MRVLAIAIAAAAMIAAVYAPVLGTETNRKSGTAAPNFGGSWMSVHERKFIPTGTGPMPVMDDPAHPHVARGRAANGRDVGTTPWVGDWRNPNLKPWVAEAVKKAGDDDMAGLGHRTAESSCWPAGVPNIMNFFEPAFFLQRSNEVTILYQRGPNVRHIYLNRPHSARITPSWYEIGRAHV